jgi:aspartyl-tRNA(Asn)/glutamyl-tRNA(Gln) amidotransferase subunit C
MKLTWDEVLHIARLARLGVNDDDVEKFKTQLSNILDNFEVLKQVDTTDIPATAQSIPLENVMRIDEIVGSSSPEETLANAPQREGDFFRVRAVLEE